MQKPHQTTRKYTTPIAGEEVTTPIAGEETGEPKGVSLEEALLEDATPEAIDAVKAERSARLSASTAASWLDPDVRALRTSRMGVLVETGDAPAVEYNSVFAAFCQLGLPVMQHGKFRQMLRENGTGEIEGFTFSVIFKEPKAAKAAKDIEEHGVDVAA